MGKKYSGDEAKLKPKPRRPRLSSGLFSGADGEAESNGPSWNKLKKKGRAEKRSWP
jgi:hypothetical protein